jgi:Transposase DDE domain group 1
MDALRRMGLAGGKVARAQCNTIRTNLLKIGARVRVTVRKVWVSLSSSCPAEIPSSRRTSACDSVQADASAGSNGRCFSLEGEAKGSTLHMPLSRSE